MENEEKGGEIIATTRGRGRKRRHRGRGRGWRRGGYMHRRGGRGRGGGQSRPYTQTVSVTNKYYYYVIITNREQRLCTKTLLLITKLLNKMYSKCTVKTYRVGQGK